MAFNFGAVAGGISDVLEDNKKLKLKEKLADKGFEDKLSLLLQGTALDRETQKLQEKRAEEKKIKELLTYYDPEIAAIIAKQGNIDTALAFGKDAFDNDLSANDYVKMVDSNPLTSGWDKSDFKTAERVVRADMANSPTVSPTESKTYAGFGDLTQEQRTPDMRLRLQPFAKDKKLNTYEASINDMYRQKFELDPENPEDQAKIKRIDTQIQDLNAQIRMVAKAKDTDGNSLNVSKVNFINVKRDAIKFEPNLSKLVKVDLTGQVQTLVEGNDTKLALGYTNAAANFKRNWLSGGYANVEQAQNTHKDLRRLAVSAKLKALATIKQRVFNNVRITKSPGEGGRKAVGGQFYDGLNIKVFESKEAAKEAIKMLKDVASDPNSKDETTAKALQSPQAVSYMNSEGTVQINAIYYPSLEKFL